MKEFVGVQTQSNKAGKNLINQPSPQLGNHSRVHEALGGKVVENKREGSSSSFFL